ncbi:cytochrome P460 family protein [Paludibaculum fermentans]|uniref:cytochrome P460 family protein n=1 Tax=Paludibaculum fermentans TaxID=1473598 RepID=UPI003EC0E235
MKRKRLRFSLFLGVLLTLLVALGLAAEDKYDVKVPGGLAFAEFKGYEGWPAISISRNEKVVAVILGNSTMIDAYKGGFPANGKAVPDGAKMAKIHWAPKKNEFFPDATVPGQLVNVDFMVKDSKRFADSGGWGYAVFDYDAASGTFKPGTKAGKPPQGNDAKCGFTCHTSAKAKDYVFTEYGAR